MEFRELFDRTPEQIRELTVNEQNPNAVEFYTRMGFVPYKRTETDEEGGPFPFRYMRL